MLPLSGTVSDGLLARNDVRPILFGLDRRNRNRTEIKSSERKPQRRLLQRLRRLPAGRIQKQKLSKPGRADDAQRSHLLRGRDLPPIFFRRRRRREKVSAAIARVVVRLPVPDSRVGRSASHGDAAARSSQLESAESRQLLLDDVASERVRDGGA